MSNKYLADATNKVLRGPVYETKNLKEGLPPNAKREPSHASATPEDGLRWVDAKIKPTEEGYYHTKGERMGTYWHNDVKKWDKGSMVTHWLSTSPTPSPSIEGEAEYCNHSGKLCSFCGYELPNHEDRCKNKLDLINWLNNECPQGTMTADLSHDFAEILRGKLNDILLTGTIPASKDNTVTNTGE